MWRWSFVAFSKPDLAACRGTFYLLASLPALAILAFHPMVELDAVALDIGVNMTGFTTAAAMCHGLLVKSRPGAGKLTGFYLCLALGGALGGLFNALLAPAIFDRLTEYPLAMAMACLAAGLTTRKRSGIAASLPSAPASGAEVLPPWPILPARSILSRRTVWSSLQPVISTVPSGLWSGTASGSWNTAPRRTDPSGSIPPAPRRPWATTSLSPAWPGC
jgi:hypothetical protein